MLCLALSAVLLNTVAEAAPPALVPLLDTIGERLAIADQVALSKWDSHKPVEDRLREREVIAAAVAQAPAYKLTDDTVEAFFAAQIEANKLVQYAHLSDWRLQGKAPDSPRPDLVGKIRPQLDQLQNHLLQQLANFSPTVPSRSARNGWPRPLMQQATSLCASWRWFGRPQSSAYSQNLRQRLPLWEAQCQQGRRNIQHPVTEISFSHAAHRLGQCAGNRHGM